MGYELPKRTGTVKIPGHPGFEAVCLLSTSIDDMFAFMAIGASDDGEGVASGLRRFGDEILQSWNLEADGEPVPATGDALCAVRDPAFAMGLLTAWMSALKEPAGPLDNASNTPSDSPEK